MSKYIYIEKDSEIYHDDNVVRIEGTCLEMCPREEVTLRRKEKLVHVLEVTKSGHNLVKCFCRSAANSNMAVPHLLRPYKVLVETVHYLLLDVSNRSDVKVSVMYDFLNDRLRAIRQDMTIQRLPPEECVVLLEPMIRFYVYYGYRLSEKSLNEYDPVLNKKYLLECMKLFLSCFNILDRNKNKNDENDAIIESLTDLNINKKQQLQCDRILVESLYILCNLGDEHPLYRYLFLPNHVKRVTALRLTYDIALAIMTGNYIRLWKMTKSLCPLTFSILCLYLPTLQRRALQIMSHAYHSKQLAVPVRVVQEYLAFNSDQEVREVCTYYGLKATDVVYFNKASFNPDVRQLPPRKQYQAKIAHMNLEDILLYTI